MQPAICVYSSSSDVVAAPYFAAAEALGAALAAHGYTLVYGRARIGLMGAVARATHAHGGRVVGIIPQVIYDKGLSYPEADELIITRDLRERKALLDARATAFVALPGGFGTLEEIVEILTLRQLQVHTRPIILLNTLGFYEPLLALFEHFYRERFAKPHRALYHVAADVPDIFAFLVDYQPQPLADKWFDPARP